MLRVFLAGPPHADHAERWVRYAADGRAIAHGRDVAARWPADAKTEIVLAAGQVRLIALALPPMPRDRLLAAARFALEDQLATTADEASIGVGEARNGHVLVAVTSDALVRAMATHARCVTRVIPESALAPHSDGWTWCASDAGDGFVRRTDGSAFAVSPAADGLPPELIAALAQTARAGGAPGAVHVAFRCDASQLARWSQSGGVTFIAAPAWHWERATPATFAAAPNFLDPQRSAGAPMRAIHPRAFKPALLLAALALFVHVGGLVSQWTWQNVERWRLSRMLIDEAGAAKLPVPATASDAAAAIARQNAQLRHRASQSAPADALPLLARAAPSLGALPPGVLRSAHYTDNAWTLELGKLDTAALSRLTRVLTSSGVDALAAPTAAGTRMRLSLAMAAR